MRKKLSHLVLAALLSTATGSAVADTTCGTWTNDRTIASVMVADACGSLTGQYAVITDSQGYQYWITSNAKNFDNVLSMAQMARIYSRTVNFYWDTENYTAQTLTKTGNCWGGGVIPKRVSILQMK
jgi:hypothetical protein